MGIWGQKIKLRERVRENMIWCSRTERATFILLFLLFFTIFTIFHYFPLFFAIFTHHHFHFVHYYLYYFLCLITISTIFTHHHHCYLYLSPPQIILPTTIYIIYPTYTIRTSLFFKTFQPLSLLNLIIKFLKLIPITYNRF